MAFFSNHLSFFCFFLLITLLSSLQIHARDSQLFFNKIPTTNSNGHIEKETKVVIPPSTLTPTTNLLPNNKYLPKNYNPVAYVTVPDEDNTTDETNSMNSGFTSGSTYDENHNNNNNQYYNSDNTDNHYYSGDITHDDNNNNNQYYDSDNTYNHYHRRDNTYDINNDDNNNNNQYYSGINTYNDQYHNGVRAASKATNFIEPSLNGDSHDYYYNNNDQLQDMSHEPRLMDKGGYTTISTSTSTASNPTNTNNYPYKNIGGKNYHYNNQEQSSNKYVKNPYENSGGFGNSYIANNEQSNNNNNFVNYYENKEEIQDEEHMP
ncbi:hypothetical protein HAX54_052821 [Datura stramonium]|uniref:Uncharacterized protein n=1 Tax=Datura stramonium TaxID=4076 RepID=A0ABS8SZH1_DATST|nr:hypothetical protein [Datura stramonium]